MGLFARELEQASDERLMELVRKGDEPAFAALYDRYQGRLMSYFHRMLWKDRERAQDFVQELFTKLAQRPESYDPSRPFSTWLFSVSAPPALMSIPVCDWLPAALASTWLLSTVRPRF